MAVLSGVHVRHQLAILTIGVVAVGAYLGAYLIRFDLSPDAVPWNTWMDTLPVFVAVRIGAATTYRLHRMLLLRVTMADVIRTLGSTTLASLLLVALVVVSRRVGFGYLGDVPLGVIILDWGLAIGGLQAIWIISAFRREDRSLAGMKRVVIVGAGESGISLALQMQRTPRHRLRPVAFVDDDSRKQRGTISGIPVEGPVERLPQVARDYQADLLLIGRPHRHTGADATARRALPAGRSAVPHPALDP